MKDRINSYRRFPKRIPFREASFSETDCQPLGIIGTAGSKTLQAPDRRSLLKPLPKMTPA